MPPNDINRNILVLLAHSRRDSLCGALAANYARGAREEGRPLRELRLHAVLRV